MLLAIPYQGIEVNRIHLTYFRYNQYGKSIARFIYKDDSIDFQDICILSPPMRVIDYNPENSRLRLDLSEHPSFIDKFHLLYENLIGTIYHYQCEFLHRNDLSLERIRRLFYYLIEENILSLYIYPNSIIKTAMGDTRRMTEIKPNDRIRCVIRLHGVSQLLAKNDIRLRLHHSVPAIWLL
jgi:hypothetical protein